MTVTSEATTTWHGEPVRRIGRDQLLIVGRRHLRDRLEGPRAKAPTPRRRPRSCSAPRTRRASAWRSRSPWPRTALLPRRSRPRHPSPSSPAPASRAATSTSTRSCPGIERERLRAHRQGREGRTARSRRRSRASRSRSRRRLPDPGSGTPRRVVLAGASGLIGSALVDSLRADGVAGHARSCADPRRRSRRGASGSPTASPSIPPCSRAPTRSSASTGRASAGSRGRPRTSPHSCGRASPRPGHSRLARARLGRRRTGVRLGVGGRLLRLRPRRATDRDCAARRDVPRRSVRRVGGRGLRGRAQSPGRGAAHGADRAPRRACSSRSCC